jgi:hypothetical protein
MIISVCIPSAKFASPVPKIIPMIGDRSVLLFM